MFLIVSLIVRSTLFVGLSNSDFRLARRSEVHSVCLSNSDFRFAQRSEAHSVCLSNSDFRLHE